MWPFPLLDLGAVLPDRLFPSPHAVAGRRLAAIFRVVHKVSADPESQFALIPALRYPMAKNRRQALDTIMGDRCCEDCRRAYYCGGSVIHIIASRQVRERTICQL